MMSSSTTCWLLSRSTSSTPGGKHEHMVGEMYLICRWNVEKESPEGTEANAGTKRQKDLIAPKETAVRSVSSRCNLRALCQESFQL